MNLPENVKTQLEDLLRDQLNSEQIKVNVEIVDVEIDVDAGEIRFQLLVGSKVSPSEFADEYFGLNRRMRRSMAQSDAYWKSFFPIITPSLGAVHA